MNHLRLLHWPLPAAVICLLGLAGGVPAVADTITPTSASLSLTEGTAGTNLALGTFTDSNTSLLVSDFSATVNWGDGSATAASVASTGTAGEFSLSGSHTYVEEGIYNAEVSVVSILGAGAAFGDNATVADAPLIDGIGIDFSASAGVVFNGEVGSFQDSNPSGTVADFSSTINWGDGTPTSSGTVTASSGVFLVSGSHAYGLPGSYSVTVQAEDAGGSTTSLVGAAEVTTPEPGVWVLVCAGLALIGLRARVTSQAG
jgi:predicted heme/steroid binding protein